MSYIDWFFWGLMNWPWLLENRPLWLFGGLLATVAVIVAIGFVLFLLRAGWDRLFPKPDPEMLHWQSPKEVKKTGLIR